MTTPNNTYPSESQIATELQTRGCDCIAATAGTIAVLTKMPIPKLLQNVANSQAKLGDALRISFQQVQRYEKGANRIGASRLQQIAQILQVPATFFFEDTPDMPATGDSKHVVASPKPVMDFMATSEGSALAKSFMRIRNIQARRRIVDLVEEIVG